MESTVLAKPPSNVKIDTDIRIAAARVAKHFKVTTPRRPAHGHLHLPHKAANDSATRHAYSPNRTGGLKISVRFRRGSMPRRGRHCRVVLRQQAVLLGLGMAVISHVWTGFLHAPSARIICQPLSRGVEGVGDEEEVQFWRDAYTFGLAEHFLINQIETLGMAWAVRMASLSRLLWRRHRLASNRHRRRHHPQPTIRAKSGAWCRSAAARIRRRCSRW